ncbi:Uncharacterized membrane protein [Butyrivibrio sp. ob235]|uniref:QueT transporter family protein n=1 Tax=unclassified Butyrivibrio TaxID=2639466 RepID=UPI0003B2F65A|nr:MULTISPECIES: QueT transporter family protein [unclassified Butyrivibrio]SEK59417.1 Uncharacterized membrane protein [Butyrivibrio sp. ob235]
MKNNNVLFITQAAMIAAIYAVLTAMIQPFDLASGAIQFRVSEALCVLPFFTPAAVPGVIIGCFISNIFAGAGVWDIVLGTFATAIAAFASYKLKDHRFLVTLPPVISNMVIVPFILILCGMVPATVASYLFTAFTVAIGEVLACVVLGSVLISALLPVRNVIFGKAADYNSNTAA